MQLAIEIVQPSVKLVTPPEWLPRMAEIIEYCGRLCHKTEELTGERTDGFIRKVARKLQHQSIEEHSAITFHFIGSRSMSHQLVRHRLNAISQESQRYCDYRHCLKVICPRGLETDRSPVPAGTSVSAVATDGDYLYEMRTPDQQLVPVHSLGNQFWQFARTTIRSYGRYLWLRDEGVPPEDARYVLPNATKTEIAMTASVRQWRHIIEMRCDKHAQWEIRGLMQDVLIILNASMPACFEDLAEKFLP